MRAVEDGRETRVDAAQLEDAGDLGEERVGEVGHHDADVLGQAAVLVHRVDVGPEIVALERGLDALAGRWGGRWRDR
jgi:hypothetical protein